MLKLIFFHSIVDPNLGLYFVLLVLFKFVNFIPLDKICFVCFLLNYDKFVTEENNLNLS